MEPLKFRAYDKEKKEWLWPYPKGFNIIGEVTVFDLLKQYRISDYKNLVIVQFIGLFDKKEEEIYKSDLVKSESGRICEVVWFTNGCYNGWDIDAINTAGEPPRPMWENLEVIGNIYSNPEMIGVK